MFNFHERKKIIKMCIVHFPSIVQRRFVSVSSGSNAIDVDVDIEWW